MTDITGLPDGAKFKALERASTSFLPSQTRAVIRLDGKNFSSFTKQFEAPYDTGFMEIMDEVTRRFASQIPGAHFGYTQSDEISVVFSDLGQRRNKKGKLTQPDMWFGGRVDKMLSVGAATVTALFMSIMGHSGSGQLPIFDARVHPLGSTEDVEEYVRWRRMDAQKNSVTMASQALFSHKKLEGVSSKKRLAMLEGTDYERLPEGFYSGRIAYREAFEQEGIQVTKSTQKFPAGEHKKVIVTRHRWVSEPATRSFMEDDFLTLNR